MVAAAGAAASTALVRHRRCVQQRWQSLGTVLQPRATLGVDSQSCERSSSPSRLAPNPGVWGGSGEGSGASDCTLARFSGGAPSRPAELGRCLYCCDAFHGCGRRLGPAPTGWLWRVRSSTTARPRTRIRRRPPARPPRAASPRPSWRPAELLFPHSPSPLPKKVYINVWWAR